MISLTPACAQETGLGPNPYWAQTVHGDYVVTGASTRKFKGPPQVDPFNVTLAGIPGGAVVRKAFANWNYLTDDPDSFVNRIITLNGNVVKGARTGKGSPDLGWGWDYATSYTADVTGIVKAAGGNGVFSVGLATDAHPVTIGEGFSLLVVYEKKDLPLNNVKVYSGYTSTSTGDAKAIFDFGADTYDSGGAHFFLNALDGQDLYTDDFYINSDLVSGDLGTVAIGNAWQGKLGPGALGTNYYDHAEGDASPYMNPGDKKLEAETAGFINGIGSGYTDQVGHSFGAISIQAVPEPSSLFLFGGGVIGVLLCRKRRARKE